MEPHQKSVPEVAGMTVSKHIDISQGWISSKQVLAMYKILNIIIALC